MTEKLEGTADPDRGAAGPVGADALGELAEQLKESREKLSPAQRRVVDYILAHPADGLFLSAAELARLSNTSDATVVRTVKDLGYAGLPEFKHELGSQLVTSTHPTRRLVSRITAARELSSQRLIEHIVGEVTERMQEMRRRFDEEQFDRATEILATAGTVFTFGVGTSRMAAEYLAVRLNRLGMSTHFARQMGFSLADDLVRLSAGDAVVLFAPGRLVREVEVILQRARDVGASTVVITDGLTLELSGEADVFLHAPVSAGGLTGEVLAASVISDTLLLALAERNEQRATEVSETLTRLRRELSAKARR